MARFDPDMRASRKRFTRPKKMQSIRRKPVGDGTATSRYMNSSAGRAAMKEALGVQRHKQANICADCGKWLPWESTRFKYRECPDGVENVAIHKGKCPVDANLGAAHEGGPTRLPSIIPVIVAIALCLAAPSFMHAQGGSISGQVILPAPPTGTGGPAPFASVRVCPYSGSSGTPCSPTQPLFYDPGLTVSAPNPASTDLYGNYSLWAPPQPYVVQVTPVAGITYSYLVMAVAGTVTSVGLSMPTNVFSVNNSPITNSGTLAVTFLPQAAGLILASPPNAFGLPTFQSLTGAYFSAQPANTVFGNCTSSSTTPSPCTLNANMIPGTLNATSFSGSVGVSGNLSATGTLSAGSSTLASLAVTGSETVGGALSATGTITSPTHNATTGYQISGSYGTNGDCIQSTGSGSQFVSCIHITTAAITGADFTVSNTTTPASMLTLTIPADAPASKSWKFHCDLAWYSSGSSPTGLNLALQISSLPSGSVSAGTQTMYGLTSGAPLMTVTTQNIFTTSLTTLGASGTATASFTPYSSFVWGTVENGAPGATLTLLASPTTVSNSTIDVTRGGECVMSY